MRICAELERTSRAGIVDRFEERIAELMRETDRVATALSVYKATQAQAC